MWLRSISFAAGVLLCQQLPVLPGWLMTSAGLLILAGLGLYTKRYAGQTLKLPGRPQIAPLIAVTLSLTAGLLWSIVSAHWLLSDSLPEALVGKPLQLTGRVIDLPDRHGNDWRFNFRVEQARYNREVVSLPEKIRLSWYRSDESLVSGQTWQLQVKLKPPSGLRNFGLFDLEGWYFQQAIRARGYVINSDRNHLLEAAGQFGFDVWREKLRSRLQQVDAHANAVAMTMALTLGDKSGIPATDWELFRRLGINHLVAISGLHIGMIATLAYWLSGRIWRFSATLCERVATPRVQAISALVFAFGYAGLAGFSLPTQRALVMIALVLISRLLLVNMQLYRQFFLALLIILAWQPWSINSAGFWLSFTAVAVIFYVLHFAQNDLLIVRLVKMQLGISLALAPLTLLFFQQVSVVSPLVNLVLIPIFSFLVVPGGLITAFLSFFDFPSTDAFIFGYLQLLQQLLEWLQIISRPEWLVIEVSGWTQKQYLLVCVMAAVAFVPIRRYMKMIGWLAGVFWISALSPRLDADQLRLTVLDVGQGSAYLVETAGRVLLYDLGPRYPGGSATRSVVLPFLQHRGIKQLDAVVISHADSDHAGDSRALQSELETADIYVGEPVSNLKPTHNCHTAAPWTWGESRFQFIAAAQATRYSGNNASCVLKISHRGFDVLLTGDIEKTVERQLVRKAPGDLASDLVLVPHHGSRSSSTAEFVSHVSAEWVINSSGYLNRYRFPAEEVKQRWTRDSAVFLDTATHGSLEFVIDSNGDILSRHTFHDRDRKYWHENRLVDRPG